MKNWLWFVAGAAVVIAIQLLASDPMDVPMVPKADRDYWKKAACEVVCDENLHPTSYTIEAETNGFGTPMLFVRDANGNLFRITK